MSELGMEALRAGRDEVLSVVGSLSDDEWAAASDCAGWRVQDVVAHMANTFRSVVEPGSGPPGGNTGSLEKTQDAWVAAQKDWSPAKVLSEYEDLSARGLEALAGLQAPGIGETVIPIEDAGQYPLHLVANALAFDHFCHLRNDVLRPNGPVDRTLPDPDDVRLGATLEWLLAGLPQMPGAAITKAVDRPITLRLDGPAGGTWTLAPGPDGVAVTEGAAPDAAATIASTTPEFVLWATRRRPWRDRDLKLDGDTEYAARVLDAIHLF